MGYDMSYFFMWSTFYCLFLYHAADRVSETMRYTLLGCTVGYFFSSYSHLFSFQQIGVKVKYVNFSFKCLLAKRGDPFVGLLKCLVIARGVAALQFTWPIELYLPHISNLTLVHKKMTYPLVHSLMLIRG